MSIIHEALKKTQVSRNLYLPDSAASQKKWLIATIVILLLLSGTAIHYMGKLHFNTLKIAFSHQPPPKKPTVAATTLPKVHLDLNGVFISKNFRMAMINNTMYQAGDTVAGMKIASIEYKSVKLVYGNQTLELKST